MASVGADGLPRTADDFVFGDEVGARIRSIKTSWKTTCRRAGITGLHFNDLRHEAGSRLLEGGWPIHYVQAMLGHSNLKQTSTYLNVPLRGLEDAMRLYDEKREACKSVAIPALSDHWPAGNSATDSAHNPHVH
jgi:integrase